MPTRIIFSAAAVFNIIVALFMLFGRGMLGPYFGLSASTGSNALFADLCAVLVGVFGALYLAVAADPGWLRPVIPFSIAGKLMAFVVVMFHLAKGDITPGLASFSFGDLLFAILFWLCLLRG
jgi:hypothetical protein